MTNPKKQYGDRKVPLQLNPPLAEIEWAKAHADGARKYGPYDWHENEVEIMTYIGAMRRHIMAFLAGETTAEDSGVHHLGHVMACCAILIDAEACGQLIDNRPKLGTGVRKALKNYESRKSESVPGLGDALKKLERENEKDLKQLEEANAHLGRSAS